MENVVRKLLQTGYGIGLLSLDQAKQAAAKVKKELHLDEKESLRLAKALAANSRKTSLDVSRVVGKQVEHLLVKGKILEPKEIATLKGMVRKRLNRQKKKK